MEQDVNKCVFKDCSKCETCIYDLPLDAVFNNKRKNMINFGIMPMANNPATAHLIFPKKEVSVPPFGIEPVQLSIPFREFEKNDLCNGCDNLRRIPRPGSPTSNCRCTADDNIPGGKVIKLNVRDEEKLKKPYWCPIIKSAILSEKMPARKASAMSDEQFAAWERSKNERLIKERWLSLPGITAWADISVGKNYHMPPMYRRRRMNVHIVQKYVGSIQAKVIETGASVWFYKQDEEYKFFSEISG